MQVGEWKLGDVCANAQAGAVGGTFLGGISTPGGNDVAVDKEVIEDEAGRCGGAFSFQSHGFPQRLQKKRHMLKMPCLWIREMNMG